MNGIGVRNLQKNKNRFFTENRLFKKEASSEERELYFKKFAHMISGAGDVKICRADLQEI